MKYIENSPKVWSEYLPIKKQDGHKYDSGHALIYGAAELTGATRLAATACARIGAGMVTVLTEAKVVNVYRASLPACILVREDLHYMSKTVTAKVYGPGGMSVVPDYESALPTVLDADALCDLPEKLSENYVLTPHEDEFLKVFPDISGGRLERAKEAAKTINSIIVLKGPETVIAEPNSRTVVNKNGSPYLATAGTGDVLAGMIGGLLAQGMPCFEAACAAVWMHAECAEKIGKGLIADDIPDYL
ncbi:MAG: NAD(P)H-hydrate dehydratase [Alphaproteobacteria bacterium]|nr:NAD(P)H-hydrate dehydratase [Alphaproteobacteria bacterium]